jgi:hypothetical protein
VSLGQHPTRTIPLKFAAAAANNFTGVELVYKDLVSFSESQSLSLVEGASPARPASKTLLPNMASRSSLLIPSRCSRDTWAFR